MVLEYRSEVIDHRELFIDFIYNLIYIIVEWNYIMVSDSEEEA